MNYKISSKHPSLKLTATAVVVALAMPQAALAATESCERLLQMVDSAGDRIKTEFGGARDVALADNADACTVYYQRVSAAGGLLLTDDAIASSATDTQTSETQTMEIQQAATIEGEVQVTLPDPQVSIDQQPADISVRAQAPEVTIDQGQPNIIVRQAKPIIRVVMNQPTITVEQPAPEIIITMPEPGVDLQTAQPMVEVNIPEPRVTVVQGEPQLNVDLGTTVAATAERDSLLERTDADGVMTVSKAGMSSDDLPAQVNYLQAEQEPTINVLGARPTVEYEAAEPQVVVDSGGDPVIEMVDGGEPKIVIQSAMNSELADAESLGIANMASTAQRDPRDAFAADPTASSLDSSSSAMLAVQDLSGLDVINSRGEDLGEVNRIVKNANDTYVVVEHGGWFFGLNDKEVAFPIDSVILSGDNVVLRGLSEEQIEAMPDYDYENEIVLANVDQVEVRKIAE